MMAMPTTIDATGCHFTMPKGTPEEMAALDASYEHLCKMRDEIVALGIIPAVADWKKDNANIYSHLDYADKVSATKEMKNILYGNE